MSGGRAGAGELQIAGLVPLSTVDWPGRLVATVFCQGCPWDCSYCHNRAILDPTVPGQVPLAALLDLLRRRRGLLDGVVFSGGEATRQHALLPAAAAVREAGFAVGLHTGGAHPARLEALLAAGLVDWVGFDVKAVPADYAALVGRAGAAERAGTSLALLQASGVPHELRTTLIPTLLPQLPELLVHLAGTGARQLVLQRARADGAAPALAVELARVPDWPEAFAAAAAAARVRGRELGIEVGVR